MKQRKEKPKVDTKNKPCKDKTSKKTPIAAFDDEDFGKNTIQFSLLNEKGDAVFEEFENIADELPFSNLNEMESETEEEEEDADEIETASTCSGYKTLEDEEDDINFDEFSARYEEDTKKIQERFYKQYLIISNMGPYQNLERLCEESYLPE